MTGTYSVPTLSPVQHIKFADSPRPMTTCLSPPAQVPDKLWMAPGGFIPRHVGGENKPVPGINDVIDTKSWGATTNAKLIGWCFFEGPAETCRQSSFSRAARHTFR